MLAIVWFTDFMVNTPPVVRMLLAIAITVGISIFFVKVFHSEILRINASPTTTDEDDPHSPPSVKDLAGRLIALSTFAFVFLLGFAFNQFWGTAKDARDAVLDEAHKYARSVAVAQAFPPDKSGPVVAALENYQSTVLQQEWPLMQAADTDRLASVQSQAATKLGDVMLAAANAGDAQTTEWSSLSSAIEDLLDDGMARTEALPSHSAFGIIMLVAVLGLANLIFVAMWQPTILKQNLYIVGVMAALTAFLLFIVVEVSNPYVGASALQPLIGLLP